MTLIEDLSTKAMLHCRPLANLTSLSVYNVLWQICVKPLQAREGQLPNTWRDWDSCGGHF